MSVEITPVVAESETGVPILDVRDLVKEFPVRAGLFKHEISTVKAVSGVSLAVKAGRTLARVGESGCGNTATGQRLLRLVEGTCGAVLFRGDGSTSRTGG